VGFVGIVGDTPRFIELFIKMASYFVIMIFFLIFTPNETILQTLKEKQCINALLFFLIRAYYYLGTYSSVESMII